MIDYRADGSILLRDDADAARTQTLSAGTSPEACEAAIAAFFAQPATLADIVAERTRRLAAGFDHDFGGDRGVHRIGTTPEDHAGWDDVSKLASAAIAIGQPEAPIGIVTETGPVQVTAMEWQLVLIAAGQWAQPIWHASFALQAMDPIPSDHADDRWWQA